MLQVKTFSDGDIEIRYKVEGESGPVYVLLHGFGGSPQDWDEAARVLSRDNRVVVPNLKVFFSHREPVSYSQQVEILSRFIHSIYDRKGVQILNLMGQSFGATLSLGVRLSGEFNVGTHVLLNPMPFFPLDRIRDPHVQILLGFGYMPGGVNFFLRTLKGRESLTALAKVFRIGALGAHEIRHINDRKLILVEKAFERFLWVDRHEDWASWEERLAHLKAGSVTKIIYSSADSLYTNADYANFAAQVHPQQVVEISHHGHLLVQDRYKEIFN